MQYRINPRNGDRISALGFGCMRFGRDEQETEKQIISAIEQGVNYFDTAYIYPGSEATLGRVLSKGYRDRVKIATKLPPYLVRKTGDLDRLLRTQLERLQTNRIDYYFIHMLPNVAEWERLKGLGVLEWIEAKKKSGEIVNIGFSYHGGVAAFKALTDAYAWEFAMIQYNYLDENSQAGKEGLLYAAGKGIPVIAMEPLRGGRLVNKLPEAALDAFRSVHPGRSAAEWGLRWVWNHPEIMCLLSGMNTQAMVDENIRIAQDAFSGALSPQELACYDQVRGILRGQGFVPCTGCNYCMPCPQKVDIPLCFSTYNDMNLLPKARARINYILHTNGHNASRCTKCGKCAPHCPQGIDIPGALQDVQATMESFPYRPVRAVVRRVMRLTDS